MLIALLVAFVAKMAVDNRTIDDRVRDAITAAVHDRMGATADVAIDSLKIEGAVDADAVQAIPEPDSRLGRVMRFTLRSGERRTRQGSATAQVRVSVNHVHAARNLDRGIEIGEGDLVAVTHDISAGALRALPMMAAASHARTLRPLAQGACLTASAIASLPAVRGGDDVKAIARFDDVEATATVTAAQSGEAGDVIRVVNRHTRRALKARVVSAGLVEIIK